MADPMSTARSAPAPSPAAGGIAARARAAAAPAAPDFFAGLNPEQRKAVETTDGPVLVLAGAGTGKTRVLTTRIAYILSQGLAYPSQVLAVTFTNKAAREMRHRIGDQIGQSIEGMPWLGTFHSICVKILRRHAELVGLKRDFTILDTDDQIRLMKQVIQAADLDEKRWPARQLASFIDSWKNKALTPDKVPVRRRLCLRRRRRRALPRLPGAAEDPERGGFRRPADGVDPPVPREPLGARGIPQPLPLHPRRRVPGHERRAVSLAAGCSRRAGGTSAASATTTSRSTAGAAPRSTTSCASRPTSPARRSSGWSATTARPRTSSTPPPT